MDTAYGIDIERAYTARIALHQSREAVLHADDIDAYVLKQDVLERAANDEDDVTMRELARPLEIVPLGERALSVGAAARF